MVTKYRRRLPKRVVKAASNPLLATPLLLMDTRTVARRYAEFTAAMPGVDVYYAVKANPTPEVLKVLRKAGARFDIASPQELADCIRVGSKPKRLSYANTVKKPCDIRDAHEAGVRLFAADSAAEVDKIAEHAPGARLFVRIDVNSTGAAWPLGGKFGASVPAAVDLLVRAARRGLTPWGVSFHAGSQQHNPTAYVHGLRACAEVFAGIAEHGLTGRMVNIGGGFPASGYTRSAPPIDEFGAHITAALTSLFDPSEVTFAAEPGRYMVADAGWMVGEVIGDGIRETRDGRQRWLTIDAGIYQGFAEAADAVIEFDIRPVATDDRSTSPAIVAGPTCDSIDVFHSTKPVMLPKMRPGNRVLIGSAGAYTTVTAAHGFNGFPAPEVICL